MDLSFYETHRQRLRTKSEYFTLIIDKLLMIIVINTPLSFLSSTEAPHLVGTLNNYSLGLGEGGVGTLSSYTFGFGGGVGTLSNYSLELGRGGWNEVVILPFP